LGLGKDEQNITVAIAGKSYQLVQRLQNGEEFLQTRKDAGVALQDIEAV